MSWGLWRGRYKEKKGSFRLCFSYVLVAAGRGRMRGNLFSVLLLLLGGLLRAGCALSSGGGSADRKGKFFSIFNIVSFPNNVCNSTVNKTGGLQYKPEYYI